jgi:hypothetical protein
LLQNFAPGPGIRRDQHHICTFGSPFLSVDIPDNSQNANDDEIDTNQIIEYLGENHDDNAKNKAGYAHP